MTITLRLDFPKTSSVPNFAPLGDTLEVEALIGLSDFAIFPKIVFETALGVNIYKVPIQAAQGQPRFCFGGNINQLTSDAMGGSRKEENKRRRHMAHFFSFLSKHSWPKRIPFPLAMNVSNVSFFENPLVFLTLKRVIPEREGGWVSHYKIQEGVKKESFS